MVSKEQPRLDISNLDKPKNVLLLGEIIWGIMDPDVRAFSLISLFALVLI